MLQTQKQVQGHDGRMWSRYKRLCSVVDAALHDHSIQSLQELETELKNFKPDFISLLQNQAKNAAHKDAVSKANVTGLPIQGQQMTQILTPDFIAEALVISELFDLNEIDAVDLLMAGESQLPYFPGLTRGLVSVLLYYDGKASLVGALRLLLQARKGRCYQLQEVSTDVMNVATRFTDMLMKENLPAKIIGLLKTFDPVGQLDHLQKPQYRALGSAKHRYLVTEKLNEIEQCLADSLFCLSCQCSLTRADTLTLIGWLTHNVMLNADGSLTDVSLTVLFSLLYSFDVKILEQQDSDGVGDKLCIISDPQYVRDVHKELFSSVTWSTSGVKALAQFSWGLTLYSLIQYNVARGFGDLCDQSESIIADAINADLFLFLRSAVLTNQKFYTEEFYIRKIHDLITDFIVQMPLLVKELRNQGDETARVMMTRQQEGLDRDERLPRDYEHLMLAIGELYSKDPLGLELSLEYWCSSDHTAQSNATNYSLAYQHNTQHRQTSLFKFVRLAGDLLLQPLYVPYVRMLNGLSTGLRSAHQCFNLLSANGDSSTVSWGHFYVTLHRYYVSLREEIPDKPDHPSYHPHHTRAITQAEVDGLIAVLQLITSVAERDEGARVSMYQNQQWLAQNTLLGLVTCNVPTRLKAQLIKCLSAFCRTQEIAAAFWSVLDEAQILPTLAYSGSMKQEPSGIIVDLEEVESRIEEYPITLAFLSLLSTLTDRPVPSGLGGGYRVPGFKPYIDYLIESVFLKFNSRAYRRPEDKWEMSGLVLEVLYKLLKRHEVSAEDFQDRSYSMVSGGQTGGASKASGHIIMLHMVSESSDLFRMILSIIDEAVRQFDQFSQFPGKSELERTTLYCLMLIELSMSKQEAFLSALREGGGGGGVMGYHVDRILLSVNPRTSRPDHLINIAKFVTYSSHLTRHSHFALRILINSCINAETHTKIVSLFTSSEELSKQLLLGFTECLEFDDREMLADNDDLQPTNTTSVDSVSLSVIRCKIRLDVIRLMQTCITHNSPNLTHFLLGFQLNKPINKTVLQNPGILGSPHTCLYSLISLLSAGVDSRSGPSCLHDKPKLSESAYRLLYTLCADPHTSTPMLRYLRQHDFLVRQVQHLPFGEGERKLESGSWLLKCLVLEMRLCALNKQRSHVLRLLQLLISDDDDINHTLFGGESGVLQDTPEFSLYDSEFSLYGPSAAKNRKTEKRGSSSRLVRLLDAVQLNIQAPSVLETKFCSSAFIEQLIKDHEVSDDLGRVMYDVRSIHQHLMYLCSTTSPENLTGPKAHVIEDIEQIVGQILQRNSYRKSVYIRRHSFDSWRQSVEIILTACPKDLLPLDSRRALIFELLHDLLDKISKEDLLSELSAPVSGLILTLTHNLSRCFVSSNSSHLTRSDQLLDSAWTNQSIRDVSIIQSADERAGSLYTGQLNVVLRGLLDHLLRSSSSSQRVRAYLYGSLLYYLTISKKSKQSNNDITDVGRGVCEGLLHADDDDVNDRMRRDCLDTLYRYGENIIDIICHDACDGHDIGRMLSLACIDSIVSIEGVEQRFTSHMLNKGYLQHIIDTLVYDNEQLQALLSPNPQPLRALYIFHSKICMLTRIACTQEGARALLSSSIMSRLAECSVFDYRPEFDRRREGFVPSVLTRYRHEILFPVLRLCLSLLTAFSNESHLAATEVLRFVVSHSDVFMTILRDRQTSHSLESMEELELTTAVISRAAVDRAAEGLVGVKDGGGMDAGRGVVQQLQNQMLALLCKHTLLDQLSAAAGQGSLLRSARDSLLQGEREGQAQVQTQIQTGAQQVIANVVTLCRNLVARSGSNSKVFRVLFNPSLMEGLQQSVRGYDEGSSVAVLSSTRQLNLGVIVSLMNNATLLFSKILDEHKLLHRKYSNIQDISVEEFKDLCVSMMTSCDDMGQYDKISSQRRAELARRFVTSTLNVKSRQLRLLSYITECCMFLLWRHLEFYLIHCVPCDSNKASQVKLSDRKPMRTLIGQVAGSPQAASSPATRPIREEKRDEVGVVMSGVTGEQLEALRKEVPLCISEAMFKRLNDMEQEYTRRRTRFCFVTALLRRIRRVMQLHT